jgi:uncharacterized protein (TIGR02594 family)
LRQGHSRREDGGMAILSEIFQVVPWIVLLVVFVGEKWQSNKVIGVLADTLQRAQAGAVAAHLPSQAAPPVALPAAVKPPVPPAPLPATGPFADYPNWFQWALHEIGAHEEGDNRGAAVQRYIDLSHCGALGDPWCAIFTNAALESSGPGGTRSPSSQSFRTHPNFTELPGPAKGCIVVYWRGSKASGQGHVGFYRGENATSIWTLGGNENDMVQIEALPKDSATFGLVGYFWPKSVPLPSIGAVMMPAGSPVSVQVAPAGPATSAPVVKGLQTNIVATFFRGPKSAYGGPIDDNSLGVALPLHFTGARPKVRVTGVKSGVSIDCDIVDVGPWNTNDPYWQTGTRPEAETGTDKSGRPTNGAGIDLTLAAARAVGIDGKGLVNWSFIETTATSTEPKVT